MATNPGPLPAQIPPLFYELHAKGESNRQIARITGVHHKTIATWLFRSNLKSNRGHAVIDIIDEDRARCCTCGQPRDIKEFQRNRRGQKYEYRVGDCNLCRKQKAYFRLNCSIERFLGDRHRRLVTRCKKENLPCSITKEQLIEQFNVQSGLCFYTDVPLVWGVGKGYQRHGLSVDKIVPEKGYITNNVVLCTSKVNTVKQDLTLEEIKEWMPGWYNRIVTK